MNLTEKDIARFWSYVEKSDGCWLWTGATDDKGYGVITICNGRQRVVKTHRIAYELAYGVSLGAMFACHTCDNPRCVRPDHIFSGTAADNNADKKSKGRLRTGERHQFAKLTQQQVDEIRARYKRNIVGAGTLAREYGVSRYTVFDIVKNRGWKTTDTHTPEKAAALIMETL